MSKLADICGDVAQVFIASVVLPSVGFGGSVSIFTAIVGLILTLMFIVLGMYVLRSPSVI